ncbi:MAG TPA: hypothetical protein VIH71_04670 [Solirubrobacteraceae bacterium]
MAMDIAAWTRALLVALYTTPPADRARELAPVVATMRRDDTVPALLAQIAVAAVERCGGDFETVLGELCDTLEANVTTGGGSVV